MIMMAIMIIQLLGAPQRPFVQSHHEETTTLPDVYNFIPHLLKGKSFQTTSSESMCEKSDLYGRSTDLTFISVTVDK
jgi:hypothetical protein